MTTQLIAPESDQFDRLFTTFVMSAYRLETLQTYGASGEDAAFESFRAGEPYTRHPGKEVWLEHIAHADAIGASMSRVHVLTEPLSEYARFEVTWAYAPNVAAGEDIRVIPLAEGDPWPKGVPRHDYWLFDDERLYLMRYAETGRFLGVEPVTSRRAVRQARAWRRNAWRHALPWSEWIATRPSLAAHVPQ